MPNRLLIILFVWTVNFSTSAQVRATEAWQGLLSSPEVVGYFSGLFNTLGIRVAETGESLTIAYTGDQVEILNGADSTACDYFVVLHTDNILRMQQHGSDGVIDQEESFMIMAALFTPLTASALTNPILSNPKRMKLGGIENHIVVNLHSPGNTRLISHTLFYLNHRWVVVPGVHGKPRRIFDLTPDQALDYQRRTFAAQRINKKSEWNKYGMWYLKWRKGMSRPVVLKK